jgi:hypothetical protein
MHGVHGCWIQDLPSIVRSGALHGDSQYGLVFFHSKWQLRNPRELEEYFHQIQRRPPRRQAFVELESHAEISTIVYGGHEEEAVEARRTGICQKRTSANKILRHTAVPEAMYIRAIWFPAGCNLHHVQAPGFTL